MTSFSWLHLTDFHCGMQQQNWLWPRMREKFLQEDLPRLHDKSGPWDLVIFTGDLTNRGTREEFQKVDELLDQLWDKFQDLGSIPKLLAVPGNHDLVRPENNNNNQYSTNPNYRQAVEDLTQNFNKISENFWNHSTLMARIVVEEAFENYKSWWENQRYKPNEINDGILPGDFSYSFQKGDAQIGIIGLNTSFCQLNNNVTKGQLSLDIRQWHESCRQFYSDGLAWGSEHHTCFLLTHHPQSWLNIESQRQLQGEIIPNYFSLHLCGHLHEADYQEIAQAGNNLQRFWLGRSLFGLEYFGQDNQYQRSHGYTAGRIDFKPREKKGKLLFWPREARKQGGWGQINIVPDYSINLEDNQHTKPTEIDLIKNYESDTAPVRLPSNQLEKTECSQWANTILTQYDQMKIWKELHEQLQKACTDLAMYGGRINENNDKLYQISYRDSLIGLCNIIQTKLNITDINNIHIRDRIEHSSIYSTLRYILNDCQSIKSHYGISDPHELASTTLIPRPINEINRDVIISDIETLEKNLNLLLKYVDDELRRVIDSFEGSLKEISL